MCKKLEGDTARTVDPRDIPYPEMSYSAIKLGQGHQKCCQPIGEQLFSFVLLVFLGVYLSLFAIFLFATIFVTVIITITIIIIIFKLLSCSHVNPFQFSPHHPAGGLSKQLCAA